MAPEVLGDLAQGNIYDSLAMEISLQSLGHWGFTKWLSGQMHTNEA